LKSASLHPYDVGFVLSMGVFALISGGVLWLSVAGAG